MTKEEYKNILFEFSGAEGALFDDLQYTGWKIDKRTYSRKCNKKLPLHFYAKIVGFVDDNALNRSWGEIWDGIVQCGKDSLKDILKKLL